MSTKSKHRFKDILIFFSVLVNFGLVAYVVFYLPPANKSPGSAVTKEGLTPFQKQKLTDAYVKRQVRKTIVSGLDPIQACYRDFLKTSPKVEEGSVIADWKIDTTGRVADSRIRSSQLQSLLLESCILREIQGWSFAPPPTGEMTDAFHQFNFKKEIPTDSRKSEASKK